MYTKESDTNKVWGNAEKLADIINDVYHNVMSSKDIHDKLFFNSSIGEISQSLRKRRFVAICGQYGYHLNNKTDLLGQIVKEALSLPYEREAEDKEESFEMFITCLKFHIAFYKKEWMTK